MLYRRRKNATPVVGMGESTSIVLNGLLIQLVCYISEGR